MGGLLTLEKNSTLKCCTYANYTHTIARTVNLICSLCLCIMQGCLYQWWRMTNHKKKPCDNLSVDGTWSNQVIIDHAHLLLPLSIIIDTKLMW